MLELTTPLPHGFDPASTVIARIDRCVATLRLARAIEGSGRRVDLAGLDGEMGAICALALDLGQERRVAIAARIRDLIGELDTLAEQVRVGFPR